MGGTPEPRWALVLWPDATTVAPSCVYLADVASAVFRGAIVIAREDAELCASIPLSQYCRQVEDDGA